MSTNASQINVTVVVHTYNQEKYINECLMSILMQDCLDKIDILIIDDCSTDTTISICHTFQEKYPNKIKIVSLQENEFKLGNLIGFEPYLDISSKYIAWCDGDDFWTDKKKISKQIKIIENDTEIAIIHTDYQVLDEREDFAKLAARGDGDRLKAKNTTSGGDLINGNHIKHSTAMILRSAIDFDFVGASRGIYAGDWLTCISAARTKKIFFLDEQTSTVRITKQGMWNGEATARHQEQKSRVRWYCAAQLPQSELRDSFRRKVVYDFVRFSISQSKPYKSIRPLAHLVRKVKK